LTWSGPSSGSARASRPAATKGGKDARRLPDRVPATPLRPLRGKPSPAQLERYFHLDDTDRGNIARCRHDHTRLGYAVQLGTVRFLGTSLANPSEVPRGVVAYLARQLGIADTSGLERYAAGEMRRDHVAEICRHYGYRDFHEGTKAAALYRWLANRAWVSAERPWDRSRNQSRFRS
jgi:hypothetical protein